MHASQGSGATPNAEAIRAQAEQARAQAEQVREQAQDMRQQMERVREQIRAELEAAGVDARTGQISIEVPPDPGPFGPRIPPEAVDISIAFFISMAAVIILTPLMRAFARRMDRRGAAATSPDIAGRLDRIEQAVDTIALEVERISEGQRFTTRLVSELHALPAPDPAAALDATLLAGRARREAAPVRGPGGDR